PARHARYCFSQLRPGSYDLVKFSPTDVKRPPFWNALGRAGRRVAIVDVPKTFPSAELNGIQLVDWGTHDPDHGYTSWPAARAAEIEERLGTPVHPVAEAGREAAASTGRGQRGAFRASRAPLLRVRSRTARVRGAARSAARARRAARRSGDAPAATGALGPLWRRFEREHSR